MTRAPKAPDVGGERWFRHTVHSLKPWAPELAAQFIAVMEAGRRLHDRASYFAVLADLLAEASHWQAAGLRPGRSTTPRADANTPRCSMCETGEPVSDDGEHFVGGDLIRCRKDTR